MATKHQLPAVFHASEFVEIGGLIPRGASFADQFRRAAAFVDKNLTGAKPGELPVEQAATLDFVINLKTAQALGLAISPSLRLQAVRVIE